MTAGRKNSSLKRQTWPPSTPTKLETIVESPRLRDETCCPPSTSVDGATQRKSTQELLDGKQEVSKGQGVSLSGAEHTQMIWYSHHLAQSYNDRERMAVKIEELERVCKYQSSTNARLLEDIQVWRDNYETAESELVETTQEMVEAKAYLRRVETANANLRYTISQLKEERAHVRKNKWLTCLQVSWNNLKSLGRQIERLVCERSTLKSTSPQPDKPSRVVAMSDRAGSKMHLLGSRNCSRTSQLALQVPELRVSTPRKIV